MDFDNAYTYLIYLRRCVSPQRLPFATQVCVYAAEFGGIPADSARLRVEK